MKTLLTLAATALLSWLGTVAVAAPPLPPATANFVSERGLAFGLRLDGQPLTRPLARQVHVDRLAPGQHWVDFSLPTPYGPPVRFRTSVWLRPGLETSYVLVLRPGFGPQLRQLGAVPLGGPAYGPGPGYNGGYPPPGPGYNGGGTYQPPAPGAPASPGGYYSGQPTAPGTYPGTVPYGNSPDPAGGYGSPAPAPNGSYPGGYDPNDGGYDPNSAPGPTGGGSCPNSAPGPNGGGYYPNSGNLYPLPPADVQNLTQALRSQPFDDQRLPMAKQALSQGLVRADELAELINTLSFDRSRIELAKYGYAHLSDQQNFYRVYGALRYASSIREVQQALGLPQN
ncbi:MAG: DUF4476 domain-containing protein [Cytophagaceae bacterium]|nr:MAG: DUF4476 domain-containing protein [Cytophagaceae bacterium]